VCWFGYGWNRSFVSFVLSSSVSCTPIHWPITCGNLPWCCIDSPVVRKVVRRSQASSSVPCCDAWLVAPVKVVCNNVSSLTFWFVSPSLGFVTAPHLLAFSFMFFIYLIIISYFPFLHTVFPYLARSPQGRIYQSPLRALTSHRWWRALGLSSQVLPHHIINRCGTICSDECLWRRRSPNCLHMINTVFLTVIESSLVAWCHGKHATREHICSVCLSMVVTLVFLFSFLLFFSPFGCFYVCFQRLVCRRWKRAVKAVAAGFVCTFRPKMVKGVIGFQIPDDLFIYI